MNKRNCKEKLPFYTDVIMTYDLKKEQKLKNKNFNNISLKQTCCAVMVYVDQLQYIFTTLYLGIGAPP